MSINNSIETKDVDVRIRPQKVAILASDDIDQEQCISIIDFLSRIWGGKYCPIFVVSDSDSEIQVQENLVATRPDIILCIGLDFSKWSKIVASICQPRGIAILNDKYVEELYTINRHKLILATSLILDAVENSPDVNRDKLYFFRGNRSSVSLFMTLSFGYLTDENVKDYVKALKAKVIQSPDNISSYLNTSQDMSKRWCWLDFASIYLSSDNLFGKNPMPPTVIVCGEKMSDYSLFWNLRAQLGIGFSGTILPFSDTEIDNIKSVESLTDWIVHGSVNANYCHIRSVSVAKSRLDHLARRLRSRLRYSKIEHVDVISKSELAPVVLRYEKSTHAKVYLSDTLVNFESIKPDFIKHTRSSSSWICDFVKISDTRRALCELVLPPRSSVIQVLNTPFPPIFTPNMDKVRWGPNSLNVRCDSIEPTISFGIPSNEELFTELLKESGIKSTKDEKRIRYNQVIRMLGGLQDAYLTFSGSSLKVIKSFFKDDETSDYRSLNKISKPLSLGEIKSKAKLRQSKASGPGYVYDVLRRYFPSHAKTIAEQRFDRYFEQDISRGADEQIIIDRLIQRGVIKRKWKLERCGLCDKEYWIEHIDINKPINCPGCGNIVTLKSQVNLGYELNELVRLAIQEGIIPVVLTANFLNNTTSEGFIWLAGLKCKYDDIVTDFDLVCICDGHLLAAECKTLDKASRNSKVWSKVAQQLNNPLQIAKKAGFEGYILASLAENYSQVFQKRVKSMSTANLKVSLLNKKDLVSGRRQVKRGEHDWPLAIYDLLIQETNKKTKSKKKKGKRIIRF